MAMEIRAATDDLLDMKAANIHVNIVNIPIIKFIAISIPRAVATPLPPHEKFVDV